MNSHTPLPSTTPATGTPAISDAGTPEPVTSFRAETGVFSVRGYRHDVDVRFADGKAELIAYKEHEPRVKPKGVQQPTIKKQSKPKISQWAGVVLGGLRTGHVDSRVFQHRWTCCHGETFDGVKVSDPCPYLNKVDTHEYCKTCGCGEWKMAQIDPILPGHWWSSKLAWPGLQCPMGRFSAMTIEGNAPKGYNQIRTTGMVLFLIPSMIRQFFRLAWAWVRRRIYKHGSS